MEVLVTYDVATDSPEGIKRLRRVAKVCEAFGMRVQKSVFECTVSPAELEKMKGRIKSRMKLSEDSLRIYRLREPRTQYLEVIGLEPVFDLHKPLLL